MSEICPICKKTLDEYNSKCPQKDKHTNWRSLWRKDKTSEKYKEYLAKRKISMQKAHLKFWYKLDKQPDPKYKDRKNRIKPLNPHKTVFSAESIEKFKKNWKESKLTKHKNEIL